MPRRMIVRQYCHSAFLHSIVQVCLNTPAFVSGSLGHQFTLHLYIMHTKSHDYALLCPSETVDFTEPGGQILKLRKRAKSDFSEGSTSSRQPSPTKRSHLASQNTFTLHIIKINQAGTDGTYSIWKDPECIIELCREKWDVPGTSGDSPLYISFAITTVCDNEDGDYEGVGLKGVPPTFILSTR